MDRYFTHFISRGDPDDAKIRLAHAYWFCDVVPAVEYDGEDYLFYEYLQYSTELSVYITEKYFGIWLNTELREILHKSQVRVPGCESIRFEDPVMFETALQTTINVMTDNFRQLSTLESSADDFKVATAAYFKDRRKLRITQILQTTFNTLNETDSSEEAGDYALENLNAIADIYSKEALEELDDEDMEEKQITPQMVKITDFGLPVIDKDSQGIFTTQLVGIEAQSGAGKTRFALGSPIYIALTKYKENVLFCALEQTEEEVKAMLLARHVYEMFHIFIVDKWIYTNTVPEEYKPQLEAARYDLFKSGKYGKFVVLETVLFVESFLHKIKTTDRLKGPFRLICIDYVGMMESQPSQYQRTKTEYEIIRDTLKLFKRFLRKSRKAGLALSQFNKSGVEAGKNDKEITTDMAQGGLAVYRNTDYNLSMSMTETMRLQGKRRFSQPKVRSSAGFPPFIANTRLGVCYFEQVATKEV